MDYTTYADVLYVDMPFAVDFEYKKGVPSKNWVENINRSNLDHYLSKDHHLYEILTKSKRKLYMDIDHVHWNAEQLNAALIDLCALVEQELHKTLDRNELVVLVSGNIESVHLIFNDVVMNYIEQSWLIDKLNDQLTFELDPEVYKKNQMFRCIHQSKQYKVNATPLIAYNHVNLIDTLICQYKEGLECSYSPPTGPKKTQSGYLTPTEVIVHFLDLRYPSIFESNKGCLWKHITRILYEFPDIYPMDDWLRLSANELFRYEDNVQYAAKLTGSMYDDCGFLYVILNTKLGQDVYYHPPRVSNGRTQSFLKTHFSDEVVANLLDKIYNSENLDPVSFTHQEKAYVLDLKTGFVTGPDLKINCFYDCLDIVEYEHSLFLNTIEEAKDELHAFFKSTDQLFILKSAWATGKTHHILKEAIAEYKDEKRSILIVTSSNSLNATNTNEFNTHLQSLGSSERFVSHLEKDKRLNEHRKVVCSIQSIGKLDNKHFDLVLIDEFESVLGSYYGHKTFPCPVKYAFESLKDILKKTEKVIVMDADISEPKIKLLQEMLDTKAVVYKNNTVSFQTVQFSLHTNTIEEYYKQIAREPGRLVIACATQSSAQDILNILGNVMFKNEQFKKNKVYTDLIATYYTTRVILYIDRDGIFVYTSNGDYHEGVEYKREEVFKNIEAFIHLHQIDLFIYSPTITTGISVNGLYFDKGFAVSSDRSVNTLEFVQMVMRVRCYIKNEIHIWVSSKLFKRDTKQADPDQVIKTIRSRMRFMNELTLVSNESTQEVRESLEDRHSRGEQRILKDPYVKLQMINIINQANTRHNLVYNFLYTFQYHKLNYKYDTSVSILDQSVQLTTNREAMKQIYYDDWCKVTVMNVNAYVVEHTRHLLKNKHPFGVKEWGAAPTDDASYIKTNRLVHLVHLSHRSQIVDQCFRLLDVTDSFEDTLENKIFNIAESLGGTDDGFLKPMNEWIHTLSEDDTIFDELIRSYDLYELWDIYIYNHKFGDLMYARSLTPVVRYENLRVDNFNLKRVEEKKIDEEKIEPKFKYDINFTEQDEVKVSTQLLHILLYNLDIHLRNPRVLRLTNASFKKILYALKSKLPELNGWILTVARKSKQPEYSFLKHILKRIDYNVMYESKHTTSPNAVIIISPNQLVHDKYFIEYDIQKAWKKSNQLVFTDQSTIIEPQRHLTEPEIQLILARKKNTLKDLKAACQTLMLNAICFNSLKIDIFKPCFYNPLMNRVYGPTEVSTELLVRSKNKDKNRHLTKKTIILQHDDVSVFENGVRSTKIITRPYSFIRPVLDIIPLQTEKDEIREFCSDFINGLINNIVINDEIKSTKQTRASY